jgi:hypothetical protein
MRQAGRSGAAAVKPAVSTSVETTGYIQDRMATGGRRSTRLKTSGARELRWHASRRSRGPKRCLGRANWCCVAVATRDGVVALDALMCARRNVESHLDNVEDEVNCVAL